MSCVTLYRIWIFPIFCGKSGYFEDLNSDERKKYIGFRCSDFDMDAYLHEPSCYDGGLPYLSIIVNLVVLSSICAICKNRKAITIQMRLPFKSKPCQKRKRKMQILIQPRLWAKSNPFQVHVESQ